jgi:hypothetical protein
MLLQGGRIIQRLRAENGASIKVLDASVVLPVQLPRSQQRTELRVIAISQLIRCPERYRSCQSHTDLGGNQFRPRQSVER